MKIHLLCAIGDYIVHTNLDPATFLASNSGPFFPLRTS